MPPGIATDVQELELEVRLLANTVTDAPDLAEGALLDAIKAAVRSFQPSALVSLKQISRRRRLMQQQRKLATTAYACDDGCASASACASEPTTLFTYGVYIQSETSLSDAEIVALQQAIQNGIPAINAATGGNSLCSIGDNGVTATTISLPAPSPLPPVPPPPRPSPTRYVPAACHVILMKKGP